MTDEPITADDLTRRYLPGRSDEPPHLAQILTAVAAASDPRPVDVLAALELLQVLRHQINGVELDLIDNANDRCGISLSDLAGCVPYEERPGVYTRYTSRQGLHRRRLRLRRGRGLWR